MQLERVASSVCPDLFGEYSDPPREEGARLYTSQQPYPGQSAHPLLFHSESSAPYRRGR